MGLLMNLLAAALVNQLGGDDEPAEQRPMGPGLNPGEAKTRKAVGLPTTARTTRYATSSGPGSGSAALMDHQRKHPSNRDINSGVKDMGRRTGDIARNLAPPRNDPKGSAWNPMSPKFAHNFLAAEDATIGNLLGLPDDFFTGDRKLGANDFDKSEMATNAALMYMPFGKIGQGIKGLARSKPMLEAAEEVPGMLNGYTTPTQMLPDNVLQFPKRG